MTRQYQIIQFCSKSARFTPFLMEYMPQYGIISLQRIRHFLAQLAHESGSFVYVREIASGSAYDTGTKAKMLGNTPKKDGDGEKFKGRGLIQITGKSNYRKCSIALFGDERLLETPELLEQPKWAVKSACWYWETHSLNAIADTDNIELITRKINGGLNGIESRKAFYERAKTIIV